MMRHWIPYGLTLATAVNVFPALGQDTPCGTETGTRRDVALYLNDNGAPKFRTIDVGEFPGALNLGYILPNNGSPPHSGMLVVKISRKSSSGTEANPFNTIRIKRDEYPYVCGARRAREAFNFFNIFGRIVYPAVNDEVPLAEYIYYHKTSSDFRQSALYNYHVNYRDRERYCVGTDDKTNGNREQFLYGQNRTRENRLVAEQIGQGLSQGFATAAVAGGVPLEKPIQGIGQQIERNSRLKQLVEEYQRLGQLETQMHPYSNDNHGCIPIEISWAQAGQQLRITVNDLERRDSHGSRLRLDETWTINLTKPNDRAQR